MLHLPTFPPHMKQAADRKKGQNWFIELLIFFLVYFVSSIGMSFILVAGSVIVILKDNRIMQQFAAGNTQQAEALMNTLLESDPLMLLTLFSNAGMILLTILFCITIQKRTAASIGFVRRKAGLHYLAGAGAGLLLFGGAVLINVLTGSMTIDGISSGFSPLLFLLFLAGFGIQGMAEEVLCRGYFMVSVGRRYSVAAAVFLNSAVFSLLHIFNPGISPLAVINLLLVGIVFSLYFLRTGNIWGVGALHSVWNFVQGNVFGMEVSGLNLSCSLFESSTDPARSFWNGGAFGPEGGFSVTIVMVIAILLLLFWKKPENEAQGTAQILQPADPQHTTQQIQDSQHVEMR
ncbi:MAG TPA: CPBP family intramembrane metalloprotease [Candidatus Mediterraneibacter stercorigallinarum]|uniref:CPBP family intramembrane metalloprotease n=1 Tax=Candidatus Mediterraneibacter stercorigallinarum TaxID=2838686 RepID=A0A9D2IKA8_9FIRM|nr:CPBP family intramembrane metalloprotease [Candidatus Mediterraneibacter stercorigallinarum]